MTSERMREMRVEGWARPASRPPLIWERCFRIGVDLVDGGAAVQEPTGHALLVPQGEALGRGRGEGGSSSGDQAEDQVLLPGLSSGGESFPGAPQARLVGNGVPGLHDVDSAQGDTGGHISH